MSNEIKFKATVVEDGVEMETELAGSITRELVDAKSRIQDKAIRQWLINQGWTPPEMNSASPDMYRALRRLVSDVELATYIEFGGTPWLKEKLAEIDYARAALAKADGE